MIRLKIVAEGDSEESFCRKLLIPYLASFGVFATVSKVETSQRHRRPDIKYKGGVTTYEHVRKDILNYLTSDRGSDLRVTTFLDFFHLPSDFPGMESLRPNMTRDVEIETLERTMYEDVGDVRFVPYIQKHEFETLMFVDILRLEELYPGHRSKVERLLRGMGGAAPEDVNGGDATSPSNRILAEFPEHARNKPKIVPVLMELGMPALTAACPHFAKWVKELQGLK